MKGESVIEHFDQDGEKKGEWTLAFDYDALCRAEELVGAIGEAMFKIQAGSLTVVRAIAWVGFQKHHPGMDMIACGNLIVELGVDEVGEKIGEAMESAFPKRKPGKKPKAKNPA